MLRRVWLFFAQACTLCLAALFVVTTLRPDLVVPQQRQIRPGRAAAGDLDTGQYAGDREFFRCREEGDALGRGHLHEQGDAAALPDRRRSGAAPVLSRSRRAAAAAACHEPGLRRDRFARRLRADQQSRDRRRRRHPARARRRPPRRRARAGNGPRIGPRRAEGRRREFSRHHLRRARPRAGRGLRARDRQPVRLRQHRDARHRQRARPQPSRHQPLRGFHPDRRRDQPGQLRRPARGYGWQPHRDQQHHLFAIGRLARHRIRDPRFVGAHRPRANHQGRRRDARLARARAAGHDRGGRPGACARQRLRRADPRYREGRSGRARGNPGTRRRARNRRQADSRQRGTARADRGAAAREHRPRSRSGASAS